MLLSRRSFFLGTGYGLGTSLASTNNNLNFLERLANFVSPTNAEAILRPQQPTVSKQIDDLEKAIERASGFEQVAKAMDDIGSYIDAIDVWERAANIAESRGDIKSQVMALDSQATLSLLSARKSSPMYKKAIEYAKNALKLINSTGQGDERRGDFYSYMGDAYARTGNERGMFENYFKALAVTRKDGTINKAINQLSKYTKSHFDKKYNQMARNAQLAMETLTPSERLATRSRLLQYEVGGYLQAQGSGAYFAANIKKSSGIFGFDEMGEAQNVVIDGFVEHYLEKMSLYDGKNSNLLEELRKKAENKKLETNSPIIARIHAVIAGYKKK